MVSTLRSTASMQFIPLFSSFLSFEHYFVAFAYDLLLHCDCFPLSLFVLSASAQLLLLSSSSSRFLDDYFSDVLFWLLLGLDWLVCLQVDANLSRGLFTIVSTIVLTVSLELGHLGISSCVHRFNCLAHLTWHLAKKKKNSGLAFETYWRLKWFSLLTFKKYFCFYMRSWETRWQVKKKPSCLWWSTCVMILTHLFSFLL